MHAQRDFAECALSYELYEFVELQCGRGQLVLLVYVTLDVLYQLVPLLQQTIVDARDSLHRGSGHGSRGRGRLGGRGQRRGQRGRHICVRHLPFGVWMTTHPPM